MCLGTINTALTHALSKYSPLPLCPSLQYLFNFTVDTTIGVFYAYLLLQVVEWAAHRWHLPRLQHSGDYGRRVDYKKWGAQLGSWLLIIFITKLTLGLIVYGLDRPISDMVVTISSAFDGNRKLELWIAMIVGPCILNFLQFWVSVQGVEGGPRGWQCSSFVVRVCARESDPRHVLEEEEAWKSMEEKRHREWCAGPSWGQRGVQQLDS